MKNGDAIEITHEMRTIPGKIEMISDNQVSALISFDAMINGHVGLMPVSRHDKDRHVYRSIIDGTEVTIRGRQR